MIARIEVTRGDLTEYPIAESTRGGWQSGVRFFPDEDVTAVLGTYHSNKSEVTDEEVAAAMLAVPLADIKIGITPAGIGKAIAALNEHRESAAWQKEGEKEHGHHENR